MSRDLPKPDHARNMRLIGYSDQGGRPDGVQVMVANGHAFIGHMFSRGFSIVDVHDPSNPKPVNYIPAPPGTWNIHLQTNDELLLVVNAKDMFAAAEFADERAYYRGQVGNVVGTAETTGKTDHTERDWTAGLAVYDISQPGAPRRIGFMPVEGGGIHRIWYTGGPWAYASVLLDGFTDYIFMTVDMSDPARPREAGRYWLPGMNQAEGQAGSLSSYEHLEPSDGLLTRAQVSVNKDEILSARTVRIANAVDRSLCTGLSHRFQIALTDQAADLIVRAFITRIIPTDEIAAAASSVASVGMTAVKAAGVVTAPIPSLRFPIGLGGLALEAEAIDSTGRQKAAIIWARGANSFSRPRASKAGDACV
jgi:Protein of unknown function (DUF3313)/LVIVD repeat